MCRFEISKRVVTRKAGQRNDIVQKVCTVVVMGIDRVSNNLAFGFPEREIDFFVFVALSVIKL